MNRRLHLFFRVLRWGGFFISLLLLLHCIRDNKIRDQYLWIYYYCGVLLEQRKIWMSWKHTPHLTSWTQESASWGGAIKPNLIWFVEEWDFSNFLARSSQKYFMGPIECVPVLGISLPVAQDRVVVARAKIVKKFNYIQIWKSHSRICLFSVVW